MTYLHRTNMNQIDPETRRLIYNRKLAGDKTKLLMKEYNCSENVLNEILNEGLEQDKKKHIENRREIEDAPLVSTEVYSNILKDYTIGDVLVNKSGMICHKVWSDLRMEFVAGKWI